MLENGTGRWACLIWDFARVLVLDLTDNPSQSATPDVLFRFSTSSFGEHKVTKQISHTDEYGFAYSHREIVRKTFKSFLILCLPNEDFGKETAGRTCLFEAFCEGIRPIRVLTPSKSASKRRAQPAVLFSKIFVWEA